MARTRSRPTASQAKKINSRHRGPDYQRDVRLKGHDDKLSDHDGKLTNQKGRLDGHDGDFTSIRKGETFNQNAIGGGPLAALSHTFQADGKTPKDPEGDANFGQNAQRAVSGDHVRAKTLRGYHFPDKGIPPAKLEDFGAGKITSGVLSNERVPELASLRGKIGRGKIDYPGNNNENVSRPFVSEMISDDSVGPRILDLAFVQDYCDQRYQSKSGRPTNANAY